ncbi:hypothetical protein WA026_021491 [Henosepilachna vigintioctopunctata]|uniref:Uncharacterized protein n=1 Tax=Henosepilachna vigintioctopunctata TaxID=420089 RepID=A0AAW1UIE1_9CUCU
MLKFVIIVIVAASVQLSNSNPAQLRAAFSNNLFECDPSRANVVVLQRILQKQGRPRAYIEEALQFPRIGLFPRPITCIAVEDLNRGGKGGYPEIVAGGVYYNSVTLSFKSQLEGSLEFSILIYTDIPRPLPYLGSSQAQNVSFH